MSKQLVTFSLLWSFVLFLAPVPALGNFDSGDCTVGDSPDGNLVISVTPTCSNDSATVEVVARSYYDIQSEESCHSSLYIRIDYICIGEDGQQIRGTPWTTDYTDRRINVTNLDTLFDVKDAHNPAFNATIQQTLQQGTNCTFYVCYKQLRNIAPFNILGKASLASCVHDVNECDTANGGCEYNCTNTIGSFICSCDTGYQVDEHGLNCTDINECDTANGGCEQNCTNTVGSFICSCDTGYQLDGNELNCSDINECNIANGGCEQNCTNTIGGFICSCDTGYQLDENGLDCSDIEKCEVDDLNSCHENAQCTNTVGSFTCFCNTGYTGDGRKCTDVNECEDGGLNHCHENASCTNTEGSFNCDCNDGYSGSGMECTDIDECKTGDDNCHENAQCTNTEGSFTCSCNPGYAGDGTECHVALTVVPESAGILMFIASVLIFIAVVLMIIAILCGSICVVHKLRKMEAEAKMDTETKMDAERSKIYSV